MHLEVGLTAKKHLKHWGLVEPRKLGKIPILTIILYFSKGWFNHQPNQVSFLGPGYVDQVLFFSFREGEIG